MKFIVVPRKKEDPGPKTRGFAKLIGSEVERVEVNEQDQIVLHCTDGSSYAISARTVLTSTVAFCDQTCLPDPSYD